MKMYNTLRAHFRVLFRREAVIEDIDNEMQLHIEMERQDNIERGMSPQEAHKAALKTFGNPVWMKDVGFDYRGGGVMDAFWRDLKYGFRVLLKTPGSTLVAVLTLALGIGATSAVFSLIQGVLLTPLPYRRPEQLVLISAARPNGQKTSYANGWAPAQWMDWQKEAKPFDAIAAYDWLSNFLVLPDGSESLEGMAVTKGYLEVVGLRPVLGRGFQDADALPNAAPVVILGYDLWRRRFNSDPNLIGRTIRLSPRRDGPLTVIGVMPPGVRFLPSPTAAQEPNYNLNAQVDFWVPAVLDPARLKDPGWNVVGRLRDAATLGDAQSELSVITTREAQVDHDFEGVAPQVQSLTDELNRDGRGILLPLFGAAALVLLIACGNVAALLLVRGLGRQQEYAVRCALGAGRPAVFRQVAAESLLQAFVGGAFGVGLALGVIKLFKLIGEHAIPRVDAVTAGWPVMLCGLCAALLCAALGGLFPALRACRLDPMRVINSAGPRSSAGRGERRLVQGVVITQTALTLVLLVGAGLLLRTMNNLAKVRPGYDTTNILTMSVTDLRGREFWTDFHTQALQRVAKLPGVEHVAFAWGVPLTGNNFPAGVEIEGQPAPNKPSDQIRIPLRVATEDYFNLLGLPILEGRGLRSTDTDKAPAVAIVNQAFADRFFPNETTVGKKLGLGFPEKKEIVGIVANGRTDSLTKNAEPEIYVPMWQFNVFSKHLVVRTASGPRAVMLAVERELRSIDPTVAVENVKTLGEIRNDSVRSRTFVTQLLVGFSLIASVLAFVGIYGVLSLSVAARRREIAIRTAIGAKRRDILNLVLAEGLRLITGGLLVGLGASIALSRVLSLFLFEVKPTDPVTLIGAALLFACVALLVCWAPCLRAAKIDPIVALHYE
jgi:putative ABC transport system permease protein